MAETVPPETLKRVQEVFDCWNRGDFTDMLSMWAEDGAFDVSAVFTDISPARGHAEVLRAWRVMLDSLDGLRMDPVDAFSLGGGRYVVDMRLWGHGRRSGAGVDRRYGYACEFRPEDGKCVRSQLFPDVESALAAAEHAGVGTD
jgi:ketosteroid isomerase-like protein